MVTKVKCQMVSIPFRLVLLIKREGTDVTCFFGKIIKEAHIAAELAKEDFMKLSI
jgi:hypothetical protein